MSKKTVLIVEDDEDIRFLLQTALSMKGYAVVTAANGEQGIEKLATHNERPCIILLDLMMPVMNGWEFLERIRERGDHSAVPVIILSGAGREALEATQAGAQGYLRKPVELNHLFGVVKQHCVTQKEPCC